MTHRLGVPATADDPFCAGARRSAGRQPPRNLHRRRIEPSPGGGTLCPVAGDIGQQSAIGRAVGEEVDAFDRTADGHVRNLRAAREPKHPRSCRRIHPTISWQRSPGRRGFHPGLRGFRAPGRGRRTSDARAGLSGRAAERPRRVGPRTASGSHEGEPRPLLLWLILRRVGPPNPAEAPGPRPLQRPPRPAGPLRSARARPPRRSARARPRRARAGRQRRVIFAAPQLPSRSTARTWTASLDARFRCGRATPVAEVLRAATFHGPPLTEYRTR